MATTKPLTTKERVANLEEAVVQLNKRLAKLEQEEAECQAQPLTSIPGLDDWKLDGPAPIQNLDPLSLKPKPAREVLFRKPIMYLYNLSGNAKQVTVDFSDAKIPDAVPEIRKDGKIVFTLDTDNYINNKYKYLYYEIEYSKPLPKGVLTVYISNDKFLSEGLTNLARLCGLWSEEITDFVGYWELELKRSNCAYWKCEVLTEKELDPIIPITVFPKPEFYIRRYIKFSESDKGSKVSSKTSKDVRLQTPFRTGELRVCEWGGVISDSGKIR